MMMLKSVKQGALTEHAKHRAGADAPGGRLAWLDDKPEMPGKGQAIGMRFVLNYTWTDPEIGLIQDS